MSIFARDTAERVATTYLEAFLAILIASWTTDFDPTIVQTAAWSAAPAGLSALKAAVASRRGKPSASLSRSV